MFLGERGEIMPNIGKSKLWFAMRVTYHREMLVKKLLDDEGIENFIPMYYQPVKGKQKKGKIVPVIYGLIFVHATFSDIQYLKKERGIEYLQYIIDSRSREKIIVPEDQMRRFIAVVGTYHESLLYFQPNELNLKKGTRVRVCGGEFEGQEGIFVKVKGARDRRVVISIQGVIAVAIAAIHPDLIEVLDEV